MAQKMTLELSMGTDGTVGVALNGVVVVTVGNKRGWLSRLDFAGPSRKNRT
jgi:hypothetical protein